jgi:3-oxoacyl-[acyl-carrier-protein] synthase-3
MPRNTIIAATGSYIPPIKVPNKYFLKHKFYLLDKEKQEYVQDSKPIEERIQKLTTITGIYERRYVSEDQVTSDIATEALKSTNYDLNSLDYLIVATNFGDVTNSHNQVDIVPSISAKVKQKSQITNPKTIAMDLVGGCPGWLMGVRTAHALIQSNLAERVAVIGAETLSRVSDPYDMDSMIYSDGAGVAIFEAQESPNLEGIISIAERTDANYSHLLKMGPSNNPSYNQNRIFLKMKGHKLYKYALRYVPDVVIESLEKADVKLQDLNLILAHQANERLDMDIIKRLLKSLNIEMTEEQIKSIIPMTINWLANSSVATIPTMLDLIIRRKLDNYSLGPNSLINMFSVGAGMNIVSMVYKFPST